ncbi:hypothetical protein BC829DRAFT_447536 [Chytridium lagenaria]|nr:hypothetical protein BC829DRAFT_447536 [Chytridium lagenaria]
MSSPSPSPSRRVVISPSPSSSLVTPKQSTTTMKSIPSPSSHSSSSATSSSSSAVSSLALAGAAVEPLSSSPSSSSSSTCTVNVVPTTATRKTASPTSLKQHIHSPNHPSPRHPSILSLSPSQLQSPPSPPPSPPPHSAPHGPSLGTSTIRIVLLKIKSKSRRQNLKTLLQHRGSSSPVSATLLGAFSNLTVIAKRGAVGEISKWFFTLVECADSTRIFTTSTLSSISPRSASAFVQQTMGHPIPHPISPMSPLYPHKPPPPHVPLNPKTKPSPQPLQQPPSSSPTSPPPPHKHHIAPFLPTNPHPQHLSPQRPTFDTHLHPLPTTRPRNLSTPQPVLLPSSHLNTLNSRDTIPSTDTSPNPNSHHHPHDTSPQPNQTFTTPSTPTTPSLPTHTQQRHPIQPPFTNLPPLPRTTTALHFLRHMRHPSKDTVSTHRTSTATDLSFDDDPVTLERDMATDLFDPMGLKRDAVWSERSLRILEKARREAESFDDDPVTLERDMATDPFDPMVVEDFGKGEEGGGWDAVWSERSLRILEKARREAES